MQAIPTSSAAVVAALLFAAASTCPITVVLALAQSEPANSQVAKPKLPPQPQAELSVVKAQYSPEGILVLGVRVTAKDKDVQLGSAGDGTMNGNDTPFSMETCYLENEKTKERINALPDVPTTPNFGPMSLLTQVPKGTWIELGVAFPRLPAPKDPARPDTYKLYVPLKAEPVEVKQLPTPPPPKAKAKPAAK
ncbi:MAG: hypothetical protein ACAI35_17205 [Candidatus Methylacidiphilales bacterium]